jgi:hypothetical protein
VIDSTDRLLAKLYRLRATVQQILSDEAGMLFNLPNGREDPVTEEKALLNALRRGIVRLRRENGTTLLPSEVDRILAAGFSNTASGTLLVELTAKGGAIWERKAGPMWDYFVDEADPQVIRGVVWIYFEAKSRAWLTCVDQTLKRFGFFATNEKRLRVRDNWRPVYWKRFNAGYALGVNTGHHAESERGMRFLKGIAVADERLDDTFSVLAGVWDSKWIASLR